MLPAGIARLTMEPAVNMNKPDTRSLQNRLQQIRARFNAADEHGGDSNGEVKQAYRELTTEIRDHSVQRHERKIADINELQRSIRFRLLGYAVFAAALLFLLALIYKAVTPNNNEATPQSLATWIEQQKLLKQVAQVQQWLASGQAESELPPPENLEELQAWLDQIKLSPDLQKIEEEASSEIGFVPFQCPVAPIQCLAGDIPSAAGQSRIELNHLVRNANAMLVETGNCEETVNLIGEYDSLFGWRQSEAITKSLVEISVAKCFMNAEDTDNASIHYTRAYCASVSNPDPHEAMTSIYGLAKIAFLDDDMQQVGNYTQCSEDLLDYHLREEPDVNTLGNYITLALMHYELTGNTRESIRVEEKGLSAARELMPTAEEYEVEDLLEVMLILQMNLMEGYLTLGETEPLNLLFEDLKSNPMLEDGDRLVAIGLLAMQDLVDDNKESAKQHLLRIIPRYKTLTEFTTVWSWDAFDRWQEETKSSRSSTVDEQIRDLRIALDTERPADALQRLNRVLAAMGGG